MKEQQEKIRVLDPHIILILFISAFVFGIGMLMIFLERKEIRTEGYEFIIFSVEILMLLLILYYMRTVVLSREGCTVSWLFWKRKYAEDYKDRYKDIFCYGISFYKKECLVKMLES